MDKEGPGFTYNDENFLIFGIHYNFLRELSKQVPSKFNIRSKSDSPPLYQMGNTIYSLEDIVGHSEKQINTPLSCRPTPCYIISELGPWPVILNFSFNSTRKNLLTIGKLKWILFVQMPLEIQDCHVTRVDIVDIIHLK